MSSEAMAVCVLEPRLEVVQVPQELLQLAGLSQGGLTALQRGLHLLPHVTDLGQPRQDSLGLVGARTPASASFCRSLQFPPRWPRGPALHAGQLALQGHDTARSLPRSWVDSDDFGLLPGSMTWFRCTRGGSFGCLGGEERVLLPVHQLLNWLHLWMPGWQRRQCERQDKGGGWTMKFSHGQRLPFSCHLCSDYVLFGKPPLSMWTLSTTIAKAQGHTLICKKSDKERN